MGKSAHTTRTSNATGADAEATFDVPLREVGLLGTRIDVSARLPDGRWQPLPRIRRCCSSPRCACRPFAARRPPAREPRFARAECEATLERASYTDVIVPVYGGREATLACLESVLATLDDTTALVVVDDASDDLALIAVLDSLAEDGRHHPAAQPRESGLRGVGQSWPRAAPEATMRSC